MKKVPRAGGRRRPSQRRSQVTVTAILDAAARVFEERGFDAGTTNHVAERAGGLKLPVLESHGLGLLLTLPGVRPLLTPRGASQGRAR